MPGEFLRRVGEGFLMLETPSVRLSARRLLVQAVLLALLLPFIFPGVFLRGEVIAPGDILFMLPPWSHYAPQDFVRPQYVLAVDPVAAFLPWYALCTDIVRNGEWPLWNHLELGGLPLLANFQSTVFYPPRLLHLIFDLGVATTLFILFKMWWCGMAAYLCGHGIGLKPATARFFSVAWMLAAYNVVWCNWPLVDVAGWLPILFLGVEKTFGGRYRTGFFLLVLGGTMMLYAGHPETAYGMCVGMASYVVCRVLIEQRWGGELFKPMGVGMAAAAFAAGLSAVLLLPFAEYMPQSLTFLSRPGMKTVVTLPFSSFIGFWVPRFFGTSAEENYWGDWDSNLYSMLYCGIAVWLGIYLLTTKGRLPELHRPRALALLFPTVLGVMLAGNIPPFDLLNGLPPFNMMLHCHNLGFTLFALPMLGTIGLEHWTSRPRHARELLPLALPLGVLALLLFQLFRYFEGLIRMHRIAGYIHVQIGVAALFIAVGIVILVLDVRWRRRNMSLVLPLITLLLATDLTFASRSLNPTLPGHLLFPRTQLTDYLRAIEPAPRVNTAMAAIPGGFPLPYGIEQWGGYDGIYPERTMVFQEDLGIGVWRNMEPACSVDIYLHDPRYSHDFPVDDPGRFSLLASLDGIEVYRNSLAFPRAFLVGGLELMDRETLFAHMVSEGYDPAKYVVAQPTEALMEVSPSLRVADPVPTQRAETLPSVHTGDRFASDSFRKTFAPFAGRAEVRARTSTRILVETESDREAVLVLTDSYYPGWRAFVDGEPAEIFPAYYAFRGLILQPGEHTVEYLYHPASFVWGMRITLASFIALCAAAWFTRPARRGPARES